MSLVPHKVLLQCLKMVMEVRSFSKSADAVNSVAPEGNQRISCMLKSATGSTEDGGKKKAKKREAKQHCQREAKKKKFKVTDNNYFPSLICSLGVFLGRGPTACDARCDRPHSGRQQGK